MLKKNTSLVVAETVINMFLNHQSFDHSKIDAYIESYQNGREQGLIIWDVGMSKENIPKTKNLAYYICQHRRSDDIAIYKGEYSMSSISEDAYKHQNFFKWNEFDKAVEWLLKEFEMKE